MSRARKTSPPTKPDARKEAHRNDGEHHVRHLVGTVENESDGTPAMRGGMRDGSGHSSQSCTIFAGQFARLPR